MAALHRIYTAQDIADEMTADGSHWWDRDTMASFGTGVVSDVFQGAGGIYFVTEDYTGFDRRNKAYTIRSYNPETKQIGKSGQLCGWSDLDEAEAEAKRLAGDDATAVDGEVTVLGEAEQLAVDLRRAGCTVTVTQCEKLIELSSEHCQLQVDACNGEVAEGHDSACERKITKLAKQVGCTGVVFSGDPRGCTVKLVLPNGDTNDFGKEGWCVPQHEAGDDDGDE